MDSPPARPAADQSGESDFTSTYIKVIVVELLIAAALYWLGVHFA